MRDTWAGSSVVYSTDCGPTRSSFQALNSSTAIVSYIRRLGRRRAACRQLAEHDPWPARRPGVGPGCGGCSPLSGTCGGGRVGYAGERGAAIGPPSHGRSALTSPTTAVHSRFSIASTCSSCAICFANNFRLLKPLSSGCRSSSGSQAKPVGCRSQTFVSCPQSRWGSQGHGCQQMHVNVPDAPSH